MNIFYDNLRQQFEYLREAQIQFDKCVNNLTGLMEQAAHMFSDVADVLPLVAEEGPAAPDALADMYENEPKTSVYSVGVDPRQPVWDVDTSPTSPPWPMPGSNVPFMTPVEGVEEVFARNDNREGEFRPIGRIPEDCPQAPVVVSYEGNFNQPSFGTVTYE